MKMMMRPQKTQFENKTYKFTTPGAGSLDLSLAKLAAGDLRYHAFMVGGAGGQSAQALGYAGTTGPYLGKAGGGGGGSLLITGHVADLPASTPYYVANKGTSPANAGNNADAPNGGNGEASWFISGTWSALGGHGGIGGDFDGNSSAGNGSGSIGGAGGGNSAGLGVPGAGGDGGFMSWDASGSPNGGDQTSATAGTFVGVGGSEVRPTPLAIGGGGGGGGGRPDLPAYSPSSAGAGGNGNNGGFAVPPTGASGSAGGFGGGGSNQQNEFGAPEEYYGSGGTGTPPRFGTGLVLVLLF